MAKIKIGKWDLIWSYVGSILKLSINVLLLPLILHFLSNEELGLWYVFASIGQLAILLDFGFAPSLSRNIAYVWAGATEIKAEKITNKVSGKVSSKTFNEVLSTCRYVYFLIAIIALVLLLSIGLLYIKSLTTSVNAIIAWVIYSIAVFFNILYSYFTSFLRGVGAIAESNKAATISKLSQLLLTFVMFVLGYGLIGVTISYLVSGLIIRITSRYYFFRYDNVKEILNKRDAEVNLGNCIEMFRSVWHNASKEGLIMISNYLSTQANTLICSSVLGLTSTGFYGLAIQITTLISNIASIPFSSYQVSLQEDAVTNNMERSRKTFSAVMVAFIGAYLVLAVFTFVSIPIIEIIKPNMIFDKWMFSTMLILFFIHQFYHLNSSFISTRNTLPYTKAFLFSSLISVCLSLFLSKYTNIGLWGLIISPLIISVSYNAWKWPTVALSYLGEISMCEFIQLGWNTLNDIVKNKSFRKKKTL